MSRFAYLHTLFLPYSGAHAATTAVFVNLSDCGWSDISLTKASNPNPTIH